MGSLCFCNSDSLLPMSKQVDYISMIMGMTISMIISMSILHPHK